MKKRGGSWFMNFFQKKEVPEPVPNKPAAPNTVTAPNKPAAPNPASAPNKPPVATQEGGSRRRKRRKTRKSRRK